MKCPRCGGTGEVEDDREVGAGYRRRREDIGVSLREVARQCGLSVSYLSDLELGRRKWSDKQRTTVERALKALR